MIPNTNKIKIDLMDFHQLVAILLGAISLKINQQFAIITITRSITIAFAPS